MGKLDRSKSDWDVMEHVLRGVRATDDGDDLPRARVVHLDGTPRTGPEFGSARFTVIGREDDDQEPPR